MEHGDEVTKGDITFCQNGTEENADKRGRTFFVNFRDKGTVLLSLSANFIITADAFASATIFGVEKRMGVILNHLGFFENPEGEESLFAACLTKNGIYGKIERRERRKKDLYVI